MNGRGYTDKLQRESKEPRIDKELAIDTTAVNSLLKKGKNKAMLQVN